MSEDLRQTVALCFMNGIDSGQHPFFQEGVQYDVSLPFAEDFDGDRRLIDALLGVLEESGLILQEITVDEGTHIKTHYPSDIGEFAVSTALDRTGFIDVASLLNVSVNQYIKDRERTMSLHFLFFEEDLHKALTFCESEVQGDAPELSF